MVKAKKYILNKRFDGFPKQDDLKLIEEELPPLKDGEYLVEAVYLSIDPYMRAYGGNIEIGSTFVGEQVAKIIESKSKDFPVGRYVLGSFGWRTHTIPSKEPAKLLGFPAPTLLADFGGLPLSLGIGVLGMPGATSYFGFLEICQPKAGETVVVSGAAGAVGSHVGQIAKIKGCYVIGIAGSDEKGKVLVEEFGFDRFINYKKPDLAKTLKEYAPKGVDIYFDNVGGIITNTVLSQMNIFGRVSACGCISGYNTKAGEEKKSLIDEVSIISKQLKVEGFIVTKWLDRYLESIEQNIKWIKEGKLKYKETITEGLENAFKAFTDMLVGGNIGKAVVKV